MPASTGCRRRGVVALELAIFLPFLVGLLLVLFTVASVAISHTEVALRARHRAWTGRHRPWRESSRYRTEPSAMAVPAQFPRILGDAVRVAPHRVVRGEATLRIPIFFLGYENVFPDAVSQHDVLGGAWDHQEIRFPEKSHHPPLTPVRKFYFFTDSGLDFSAFRALAGFVSADLAAEQAAANANHGSVAGQHSPVEDLSDPGRVIDGIRQREAELADVEADLEDARNQDPPDTSRINDLERQRDRIERELAMLYTALENLRRAGRLD